MTGKRFIVTDRLDEAGDVADLDAILRDVTLDDARNEAGEDD